MKPIVVTMLVALMVAVVVVCIRSLPNDGAGSDGCSDHPSTSDCASFDYVSFDLSPTGDEMVFSSTDGDIYLYSFKIKQKKPLTQTQDWEFHPHFSPDGKYIVYTFSTGSQRTEVHLRSVDGKVVRRLSTDTRVSDGDASFSPDGSRIVFVRAHLHRKYAFGGYMWSAQDVCVMDTSGKNQKRLTNEKYYLVYSPHFLDKNTIVYTDVRGYELPGNLLTVKVDSCKIEKITLPAFNNHEIWMGDIAVSPKTRQIAFMADTQASQSYDINLLSKQMNRVDSLNVTSLYAQIKCPVFSPKSFLMFYLAATKPKGERDYYYDLYKVDLKTKTPQKVADSSLFQ